MRLVLEGPTGRRAWGPAFAPAARHPLEYEGQRYGVLLFSRSLAPAERTRLEAFLTRLERDLLLAENRLSSDLLKALGDAEAPADLARAFSRALRHYLGADNVGVWTWRRGRFYFLAQDGMLFPQEKRLFTEGLRPGEGLSWRVYRSGEPLYVERYDQKAGALPPERTGPVGALAVVPVERGRRPRRLLAVRVQAPRFWTRADAAAIEKTARALASEFARLDLAARLGTLLQLERLLPEGDERRFFKALLEAAVDLVPGAEAGSLLVREGRHFRYRATVGFDFEALAAHAYSEADMANWGGNHWAAGRPRILRRRVHQRSRETAPASLEAAARLPEIRANLLVPIVKDGQILAALNLDSFTDEGAFDHRSIEVAKGFALQAAAMLHEAAMHEALAFSARHDPLTGLLNRRGFAEAFAREREGRRRLAVLILDLVGFKGINDRHGHPVGDRALVLVARALAEGVRQGEYVARWGGDEFALLIGAGDAAAAQSALRRLRAAIAALAVEGEPLAARGGYALFPAEGRRLEELVRRADARLYAERRLS